MVVTCNYDLTVRRLTRALKGLDVWLVVAPSAGINVWCAASGGHLGTHQVVTALKTSGVAEQVRHRRAILPQLAATGVERREVTRRCGWKVRFGPVYGEDLPRYLAAGEHKDEAMRRVRFSARERAEMAVAWGVPAALVLGALALWRAPGWALPGMGLAIGLAGAVFFGFERLPEPRRPVLAALAGAASLALIAAAGGGALALAAGALASVGLSLLLTFDYTGSTPTHGGSHFEEHRWHIALDAERCRGVYSCWEVCPEACFEKPPEAEELDDLGALRGPGSRDRRQAGARVGPRGRPAIVLAHDERCIRCGACVVQCPFDALAFEDEDGQRIDPDTIRRYKLNLLGRRSVEAPRLDT